MGKRKSSKKPVARAKMQPLDKTFKCLFCNHMGTVTCKIDNKKHQGRLDCKDCNQHFLCDTNHLTEAIDIYSEWLDACQAVNARPGADSDDDRPRAPAAAARPAAAQGSVMQQKKAQNAAKQQQKKRRGGANDDDDEDEEEEEEDAEDSDEDLPELDVDRRNRETAEARPAGGGLKRAGGQAVRQDDGDDNDEDDEREEGDSRPRKKTRAVADSDEDDE